MTDPVEVSAGEGGPSDPRADQGAAFRRRTGSADTRRKIAGWEIWDCADPTFAHVYDRRTSLFVHEGRATLTFTNGETVDLQPGDFLTIEDGAEARWEISEALRNSYIYHDTFRSAENRAAQIHWRDRE